MDNWRKRSSRSRCIHGLTVTCCILLMVICICVIVWISYLLVNSGTVYPSEETVKWQSLMKHLLFINCVLIIMAGIGIVTTVKEEAGILMLCVVLAFGALFAVLALSTSQLAYLNHTAAATSLLDIKNNVTAYFKRSQKNHQDYCSDNVKLPEWLDYIQLHGPSCCGIMSYKDWQSFWPECPTKIPKSCCIKSGAQCPTTNISNTPSSYFKIDGCGSAILQHMHLQFHLTLYSLMLLLVAVTLTFVAFLTKYLQSCCNGRRGKYVLNGEHGSGSVQYSTAFLVGFWYRVKYEIVKKASSLRSRISRGDHHQRGEDTSTGDSINNFSAIGNDAYPFEEGELMARPSNGSMDLQVAKDRQTSEVSLEHNQQATRMQEIRQLDTNEVTIEEPSDAIIITEEPSVEAVAEQFPQRKSPLVLEATQEGRRKSTLRQLLKFGRRAGKNKRLDSETDAA